MDNLVNAVEYRNQMKKVGLQPEELNKAVHVPIPKGVDCGTCTVTVTASDVQQGFWDWICMQVEQVGLADDITYTKLMELVANAESE